MVCLFHKEIYVSDEGSNEAILCGKCRSVKSVHLKKPPEKSEDEDWWDDSSQIIRMKYASSERHKNVPSVAEYLKLVDAKITKNTKMDGYTRKQLALLDLQ